MISLGTKEMLKTLRKYKWTKGWTLTTWQIKNLIGIGCCPITALTNGRFTNSEYLLAAQACGIEKEEALEIATASDNKNHPFRKELEELLGVK